MADGVEAVKAQLAREFGLTEISEGYDVTTRESIFDFHCEGRDFTVRVSREYDEDCASGQVHVDLRQLGSFLHASKDGRVRVMRSGISFFEVTQISN